MKMLPVPVAKMMQGKYLLFFCPEKVAFIQVSGIITTNLGKTATHIKIAGREKTDTSLQNMPFSQTGEGHFFWLRFHQKYSKKNIYNQPVKSYFMGKLADSWRVCGRHGYNISYARPGAVHGQSKPLH